MKRRKFFTWIGVGSLTTYLSSAMVACSSQNTEVSQQDSNPSPTIDQTPRSDGFVAIATTTELADKGQIVNKDKDVIIFRDPFDDQLVALNSLCPHQGCTVKWDTDDDNLGCSCHGSVFAKDGTVIEGPANKALAMYEVKEEEGNILVKLAS